MKTLQEYAAIVNDRLNTIIPELAEDHFAEREIPGLLARSMRYSLLAGGKRLRPSMLLAAVEMLGGEIDDALDFACAVEMIHTYSLIHDDLPGMDDDTLRRGRATNHVVFGVGQAILAGDGLLNGAFERMLEAAMKRPEQASCALNAIREIAEGAGVRGMIAGQVIDLDCEHRSLVSEDALNCMQYGKTACMFIHPLRAAGFLAGAEPEWIEALGRYGEMFGRVFQASDDLLDVVGTKEAMGKTLGKDAEQGKLTSVALYGVEGTRRKIAEMTAEGMRVLDIFDERADFFRDLLARMTNRTN